MFKEALHLLSELGIVIYDFQQGSSAVALDKVYVRDCTSLISNSIPNQSYIFAQVSPSP
jgi:hypothetical protein